jgi:hypothetical protein
MMESPTALTQVRVPHVLPAASQSWTETEYRNHEQFLAKALRNCGIASDKGTQVLLIAPAEMYWYSVLVNAVYRETGAYPYLVQTAARRASIGNPGEIRILDGHGFMGLKE